MVRPGMHMPSSSELAPAGRAPHKRSTHLCLGGRDGTKPNPPRGGPGLWNKPIDASITGAESIMSQTPCGSIPRT
eukprot:366435-Chlamydomonas_euryale.AAC.6